MPDETQPTPEQKPQGAAIPAREKRVDTGAPKFKEPLVNENPPEGKADELPQHEELSRLTAQLKETQERLKDSLNTQESLRSNLVNLSEEKKSLLKENDSLRATFQPGDNYIGPDKKEIYLSLVGGAGATLDFTKLNPSIIDTFANNLPGIAAVLHKAVANHKNFKA